MVELVWHLNLFQAMEKNWYYSYSLFKKNGESATLMRERQWKSFVVRPFKINCMFDVLRARTICTHFWKNSHKKVFVLFFECSFCFSFKAFPLLMSTPFNHYWGSQGGRRFSLPVPYLYYYCSPCSHIDICLAPFWFSPFSCSLLCNKVTTWDACTLLSWGQSQPMHSSNKGCNL